LHAGLLSTMQLFCRKKENYSSLVRDSNDYTMNLGLAINSLIHLNYYYYFIIIIFTSFKSFNTVSNQPNYY
jgi:hypothetical protein